MGGEGVEGVRVEGGVAEVAGQGRAEGGKTREGQVERVDRVSRDLQENK